MIFNSQAAWFVGNSIANIIGGLVAYGIGHISTSVLEHWKLLFLILGAVTSGYAVILMAFLPDSPAKAIFLKKKERLIAIQRTLVNKVGVMDDGEFKWNQVWLAAKDPQTWFLVLYTFCVNICNGGVTSVRILREIFF
jgi:MFS family permease